MFLCALVGPLFPPAPAPCLLFVPFLCVRLSCSCFFLFRVRAPRCSRAPCVCPLLFSVSPLLAALRPLSRLSPLPFSFRLSTLPVRLPSLSVPRCHSCVPPACSTPAPPPHPYPFPWGLPHPCAPSVAASHPILVAWCPVWGGGGLSPDWTVALPQVCHGRWFPTHHEPPHVPKEHRENVRETLVEFPSLHLHCGARPHRQGSHSVAPRRCPMAPVATTAWRGQPLRAGRTYVQCFQCSTILSCRELCYDVPSRRIARALRLPVHRGATETWLHCTGLHLVI